jgi:hypothetical protein
MTYQPDLAYWPSAGFTYRRPDPAVSILQSLCAGLALVAVNVTLFVWLVA